MKNTARTVDFDDDSQAAFNFRRGRPRSEKSRAAILRATNSLLTHMSVQELSIEAIAKKAKVGKTTIYRWWPNKTAVVMEALSSQPGAVAPVAAAEPATHAEAVALQLEKLIRLLQGRNGAAIAQLFSAAQGDHKSQEIFSAHFLAPLIDAIEYSVAQGQKAGEFRKDTDAKLAVDVLCGPVFFRAMAHPVDLDDAFLNAYPDRAVALIGA